MSERIQGSIKNYNDAKGYGFIRYGDNESIFVHIRDVTGASILNEGDTVEFEIGPGRDDKTKAMNVTVIK